MIDFDFNDYGSDPAITPPPTDEVGRSELLSMVNRAAAGTLSRRGFVALAGAIAGGQLLASQLGPMRKAFGAPLAAGAGSRPPVPAGRAGNGNVVVVFLGGGNDGLNTLVPVTDPEYHRLRPSIKLMPTETLSLGTDVALGLHPSLVNVQRRYLLGQVGLITGVGYNVPDLSHFNSLDHWEGGYGAPGSAITNAQSGWLGRWLDSINPGPFAAISFRADDKTAAGSTTDPLRLRPWDADLTGAPTTDPMELLAQEAFAGMAGRTGLGTYADDLGELITKSTGAGSVVGPALKNIPNGVSYIGRELIMAARLLNAGVGVRVVTTVHGGFDTHSEQAIRGNNGNAFGWHGKLLADLDNALESFFAEASAATRANTTILVYSEFGRRVEENGSHGTDHGAAGVSMVLGEQVNGGIFGDQPLLTDLNDGNLKMNIDFRSIQATLLSRFLGADDTAIIGAAHQRLLLSKADASGVATTTTSTTSTTSTSTSTTRVATTLAPTTLAPTTQAPATTAASTTAAPTTQALVTTAASTTAASTTAAPTTAAPTTAPATTVAGTTVAPTTVAPTTASTTLLAPTSAASTTAATTVPGSTVAQTTRPTTTAASTTTSISSSTTIARPTTTTNFPPPKVVTPTPRIGKPADPDPVKPNPIPSPPAGATPAAEPAPASAQPEVSTGSPTTIGVPDPTVGSGPVLEPSVPSTSVASTPSSAPSNQPTTTLPKRLALKPRSRPTTTKKLKAKRQKAQKAQKVVAKAPVTVQKISR
jgi:uncharacterized protein (DUF1501 family)